MAYYHHNSALWHMLITRTELNMLITRTELNMLITETILLFTTNRLWLRSIHKNRAEYVNHKIVNRRVKPSKTSSFVRIYQQPEKEKHNVAKHVVKESVPLKTCFLHWSWSAYSSVRLHNLLQNRLENEIVKK